MKIIKQNILPTFLVKSAMIALLSTPLLACSTQGEPKTIASSAGCESLSGQEEALNHVYAQGAVYDAKPIKQRIFKARANQPIRTMGASLYIRPTADLNAPYLRRVLACHAGSDAAAHPNDPLHPQSGEVTSIEVREARHGFAIDILADRTEVGEEIYQRAESLSQGKGSVQIQQVALGMGATAM